jgi:hypothetical protein
MMGTMLVDLDHLLAAPIYDPLRCSMGFHPLHSVIPVGIYVLLCFIPKLRVVGIGLIIHMLLDTADCLVMPGGIENLRVFLSLPFISLL